MLIFIENMLNVKSSLVQRGCIKYSDYLKWIFLLTLCFFCIITIGNPDGAVSFTINDIEYHKHGDHPIVTFHGLSVTLRCTTRSHAPAKEMSLEHDTSGRQLNVTLNSVTVVYTVSQVNCSNRGSYYCRATYSNGHTFVSKIDLDVRKCPPKFCRHTSLNQNITAVLETTVKINICVFANIISSNYPIFMYGGLIFRAHTYNDKFALISDRNFSSKLHNHMEIHIKNITKDDERDFNFTIMTGPIDEIIIPVRLNVVGHSVDVNFSSYHKVSEHEMELLCTAAGPVTLMTILRYSKIQIQKMITTLGNNTAQKLKHEFPTISCNSVGNYRCDVIDSVGHVTSRSLELGIKGCPPIFCDNTLNEPHSYAASPGGSVTVTLCVVTEDGISEVELDGTTYHLNQIQYGNLLVSSSRQGSVQLINITISKVQHFETFHVKLKSEEIIGHYLNHSFSVRRHKENEHIEITSTNVSHGDNEEKSRQHLSRGCTFTANNLTYCRKQHYNKLHPTVGSRIVLACQSENKNESSDMSIKDTNGHVLTFARSQNSTHYTIDSFQCGDVGNYSCHIFSSHTTVQSLILVSEQCKLNLCERDRKAHEVGVVVGHVTTLTLCVLAHGRDLHTCLDESISARTLECRMVHISPSESRLSVAVELLSTQDLGLVRLFVNTTLGERMHHEFKLVGKETLLRPNGAINTAQGIEFITRYNLILIFGALLISILKFMISN